MVEREMTEREMRAVRDLANLVAETIAKFTGDPVEFVSLALVLSDQHIIFGDATRKIADAAYLAGVQHGVGQVEEQYEGTGIAG